MNRIALGQDVCMKIRLARYGGHGYDHLLANVRPEMIERGWDQKTLDALLIENPRRLLAG
jgi:phosphotriesterase-related protein